MSLSGLCATFITAGVEKALSAVLVDKQTGRMIAMGEEARRCFAEALDSKAANLRCVALVRA